MGGAALTVVTRSNGLWTLVRFKPHHLPERFLHVSCQAAKHPCLRALLEHLWYSVLLWVQFLTRMLRKSLFISKKKEINCGIFSFFSWVVFYILSPIFTEIKCAPQKRWSYAIKLIKIKNALGRSRMFDTTSVFSKWITVIRKRSCKKQYRTSRNVTDFPQKQKYNNNYGIFLIK